MAVMVSATEASLFTFLHRTITSALTSPTTQHHTHHIQASPLLLPAPDCQCHSTTTHTQAHTHCLHTHTYSAVNIGSLRAHKLHVSFFEHVSKAASARRTRGWHERWQRHTQTYTALPSHAHTCTHISTHKYT